MAEEKIEKVFNLFDENGELHIFFRKKTDNLPCWFNQERLKVAWEELFDGKRTHQREVLEYFFTIESKAVILGGFPRRMLYSMLHNGPSRYPHLMLKKKFCSNIVDYVTSFIGGRDKIYEWENLYYLDANNTHDIDIFIDQPVANLIEMAKHLKQRFGEKNVEFLLSENALTIVDPNKNLFAVQLISTQTSVKNTFSWFDVDVCKVGLEFTNGQINMFLTESAWWSNVEKSIYIKPSTFKKLDVARIAKLRKIPFMKLKPCQSLCDQNEIIGVQQSLENAYTMIREMKGDSLSRTKIPRSLDRGCFYNQDWCDDKIYLENDVTLIEIVSSSVEEVRQPSVALCFTHLALAKTAVYVRHYAWKKSHNPHLYLNVQYTPSNYPRMSSKQYRALDTFDKKQMAKVHWKILWNKMIGLDVSRPLSFAWSNDGELWKQFHIDGLTKGRMWGKNGFFVPLHI